MRDLCRWAPVVVACAALGCQPAGRGPTSVRPPEEPAPKAVPAVRPGPAASQPAEQLPPPTTRPARVLFQETFSEGPSPRPDRWLVRNPAGQRVVVESGALVVRSDSADQPTKVELQVQEPLPGLGQWSLQFDALINSLWGQGRGEVRVELRDYAARSEPEGTDFVLAERHWDEQSGLKFGIFRDGAFIGWHEVAPVGQLGAWHHYRVDYDGGVLTLWRDGERALECDVVALLERPLAEGVTIEMGFHLPQGSGIEGCIDNVVIVAHDAD